MASYKGVIGVMMALEEFFKSRLPEEFKQRGVNAKVKLLGSTDISKPISGNTLGIYLHRVTVDPHGRTRFFPNKGSSADASNPELPVNLHFLLIATGTSAAIEADLVSWAMVELANEVQLDVSQLAETDTEWGERELVTIAPEDMSNEDLMRIWDVFEAKYTITVPYMIRTVRLRLSPPRVEGPPVVSRVFPTGTV